MPYINGNRPIFPDGQPVADHCSIVLAACTVDYWNILLQITEVNSVYTLKIGIKHCVRSNDYANRGK